MSMNRVEPAKTSSSPACTSTGSAHAEALARAGVGRLVLVDGDTVSLTNLNRQLVALHSTLGQSKAQVMAQRVQDINPDCRVEAHTS